MKLSIIIPAYNEEKRIERTICTYGDFFKNLQTKQTQKAQQELETNFIIVLNGCKDKTCEIVQNIQKKYPNTDRSKNFIDIINLEEAGKGLAVVTGFAHALQNNNDLIGFVDADMATQPEYFYELVEKKGKHDVIFASRYMKESCVTPKRPGYKTWGRKLIFNPLVTLLMGLRFKDFQCGAKLFTAEVLKTIIPHVTMKSWAFDIELLYLSKKYGFRLQEIPTTWHDQADSKFQSIGAGSKMLSAIVKLRLRHSWFKNLFTKQKN